MSIADCPKLSFSFPASVDMVSLVREYTSQLLVAQGFSEGFSYRTEIIIDELWRNAVMYGITSPTARIEVVLSFCSDRLELTIINSGGTKQGLLELQKRLAPVNLDSEETLGLNIVRVLTDSIDAQQLDDGRIAVTIVRKKVL